MIINLSNHPVKEWSEEQVIMARQRFGEIYDMPFPDIDPEWEISAVHKLAMFYSRQCSQSLENSKDPHNAIHIMGELTFCFQFVRLMQQHGVLCLASTTERIAEVTANGKISRFVFKSFRPYY